MPVVLTESAGGLHGFIVFALHHFDRRFSGHVGECGPGRIGIIEVQGDLYSREQIEQAVVRSDALIDEGIRMGTGSRENEPDMAHLRQDHPGSTDRAVSRAPDRGRSVHR